MSIYKNIFILTGAGISAESGLSTFRSSNGLWNNHPVSDVATIEAFERNPEYVHEFYNELKPELNKAKPNNAHLALAKLQNECPANINIITQNVDTLHEKAKSKNIYHIHGQINQTKCLNCEHIIESFNDMHSYNECPNCKNKGFLKPNIVFFGENLLYMDKVDELLKSCDLFLSIGTSGLVFPAADFVRIAKLCGATTYEFNLNQTSNNWYFDHHIYGKAGETLPGFVDDLIAEYKSSTKS